jgi:plasmid stabilization system protein ParE
MPTVTFLPEAKAELFEATLYYEEQAVGLGVDFEREVQRAVADLRNHPHAWPKFPDGTRRHMLMHFPYLLVYVPFPKHIWIVAVAHAKRRPRYWSSRVTGTKA